MTIIKGYCSGHKQDVELTPAEISLVLCKYNAKLSSYSFTCPECGFLNYKPADDHIASLLMSGGVKMELMEVPAELLEPRTGEPLTLDDLIDLHQELADL